MASFDGFKGDYKGLTASEAEEQLKKWGKNELTPKKKKTLLSQILSVVAEPMQLLLLVTATMYFVLKEPRDGIIMLVFVVFIACIEIFQEWRTERTLSALAQLTDPRIRVIRDDTITEIDSVLLVPGDLMVLEEGDQIPADGKILEMTDLGINESSLTGEAEIVWKTLQPGEERHFALDVCYSGTTVIQGCAIVEVFATGARSQYGRIGKDIAEAQERPTPLQRQTAKLVKISAIVAFIMFVLVFAATMVENLATHLWPDALKHGLMSGLTLAMGMIPEEFPVILAVFLAMGAWRLGKKQALIRHIPSVETLGAVSVLCVDKTGTLTLNKMTVDHTVPLFGFGQPQLLRAAVLACEDNPFDPMEQAILAYGIKDGIEKQAPGALLHEYPFSSETKMMGHIYEENGKRMLYAKGAAELMVHMCLCTQEQRDAYEQNLAAMTGKGLRVIAVARAVMEEEYPLELSMCTVEILGLIGLQDPPREEVRPAIQRCQKAGIRIVMITGDNPATASAIAAKTGIAHPENVILGSEIESMSEEELSRRLPRTNVFARVMPRHKLRIVEAFKSMGETVAMTGDGVNDAPALKASDIGIAMGERGTGVAKEAADMILLDDNFTTIVETVHDGRRIYDNIRKAIGYVLSVHIPIALIALLTPLLHMPLLLLPIHVVLLELIIDPICSVVFEKQPPEPNIMDRPPRSSSEKLLTGRVLWKAVLQGVIIFATSFGAYAFLQGKNEALARTVALAVLIFANMLLVYVNHSETVPAYKGILRLSHGRGLWWLIPAILGVLGLLIYFPPLQAVAGTVALNGQELLLTLALALAAGLAWEPVKLISYLKRKLQKQSKDTAISK